MHDKNLIKITFYKIGMGFYEGKEDRNSGLYEYDLILNELKKIDKIVKYNTLIVLNGKAQDGEIEKVKDMIEQAHLYDAKAIYIVTDSVAFENVDLINMFDLVLHQAWDFNFDCIKTEQMYSYVPELFFTGKELDESKECNNVVLFCGNDTGRKDKINEYVRGKNGTKRFVFSLLKTEGGNDERIPHDMYLRLQDLCKYSLIICREDYRNCGWLTARLFEALDAGSLPLVDMDYDVNFAYNLVGLKVFNKYELNKLIKYFNRNEEERISVLKRLRYEASERREMFLKNIAYYCLDK